jgi:hypothetical protein
MELRKRAVVAVLVPGLALGLAACGGGGATDKKPTVSPQVAARHWKAGLMRWRHSTQQALNGISVIFSTEASLVDLGRGRSKSSHSLVIYEQVLTRCSSTVRGLGPVPPELELAGRYALLACTNLEKGERGVEALVVRLRHGQGFDTLSPLTGAGGQLSMGQAQLNTVFHALNQAPE